MILGRASDVGRGRGPQGGLHEGGALSGVRARGLQGWDRGRESANLSVAQLLKKLPSRCISWVLPPKSWRGQREEHSGHQEDGCACLWSAGRGSWTGSDRAVTLGC